MMPSSCAGNRGLNGVDIVADACSDDVRDAGEAELIVPLRGGSAVGPDERLGRGPGQEGGADAARVGNICASSTTKS